MRHRPVRHEPPTAHLAPNAQFSAADWALAERFLREGWSPEQLTAGAANLSRFGQWKGDTVLGNARLQQHIGAQPRPVQMPTPDDWTELHIPQKIHVA